jgi:FkbM family methyltransferase
MIVGNSESAADRLALRIMRPLRSVMRLLRTGKTSVPAIEKLLRGAALAPLFAIFMVPLFAQIRSQRSIVVSGRTNFGAEFTCRLPDLIQTYVWVFNEWEPDLTRFIAGRLRNGDVFVDVGANIGYYSVLAAECVGPTGRVVAIEASPTVFADLRGHLSGNAVEGRVRAENKAAGAEPGTLSIYSGPVHNVGMSTTLGKHGEGSVESIVEAQPLWNLLSQDDVDAIRLIKIDVEGAEPDVVAGMIDLIPRLPAGAEIILELSPKWWSDPSLRPLDVLRPFTDAGFCVYEMRNNYSAWRYLWPNDVSDATRVRRELIKRVTRLDLVLSRVDGDRLQIDSRAFLSRFATTSA